ncbi:MAG TPA: carboxypeptidase-like regulatory domain-containing protein, partial [Acidobacteriota bacterium]|nr:carboxypeptidase-like regulatory domain-containing protein [Acidobacteriota bacterium]
MIRRVSLVSFVLALLTFGTPRAQVIQGSILGIVTDASGATIPGVEVTVRHQGTNIRRSMVTNDRGEYRIGGLEAGLYEVSAELPGFRAFRQTDVEVNLGQSRRVNIQLELGEVSDEVTVGSSLSQIDTESATISNVKSDRDYKQLPLSIFGRGWANITNVTAGVQSKSGFEVNGARDTANNFTSDGISVNDITSSRNTANGFSGEIEMLQEVKIMTTNASAEYAQVAQFAAVSRSGTNDLHGSLYWGNFNSYFSARQWESPTGASFTNHNMFAVTNGGPIFIPGLYDGRDRTFYFFSYGGARYRIG